MINREIYQLIQDTTFHARELQKFLKSLKTDNYNEYLEDLIDYAMCIEEDIENIHEYIHQLEINLYLLNFGGDTNE